MWKLASGFLVNLWVLVILGDFVLAWGCSLGDCGGVFLDESWEFGVQAVVQGSLILCS